MKNACWLAILVSVSLTRPVWGVDNWPQFRGPGALGVAENPDLPYKWSPTENVLWSTALRGRGWSSPVVWGNRIFLTTVVAEGETEEPKLGLYFGGNRPTPPQSVHRWKVICLDRDRGELVWEHLVHEGVPQSPRHLKNSYASETPTTDGENIYVYFGNLGIFCYSMDGDLRWSRKMPLHATRFDWGTAASPVLYQDRLYVVDDNEEESTLFALDKNTGKEIWRDVRDERSNWSTPYIWENELRTEIITPGTGKVRSYDLEGKLLYEFGGCSSITIATPYSQHGLLYVSSGYVMDKKKPIFALRPGGSGDISLGEDETSNQTIAWCQKQAAPYNPSTLVYGDLLYVLLDRGFLSCYDARTGEPVYEKQRLPEGRAFTSSPWAYNGKVFCLNEYGVTYVVQAGREFKLLHTNRFVEEEICMATPAIVGDRLIVRTADRVYCLKKES